MSKEKYIKRDTCQKRHISKEIHVKRVICPFDTTKETYGIVACKLQAKKSLPAGFGLLYICKRGIYLHKRDPSICKPDLHIYKMYIRKRNSGIWAWVYMQKRPRCVYERDLCICKRDLYICRRDRQTEAGKSRLAYQIPKKQRDLGVHAKETYIYIRKRPMYM